MIDELIEKYKYKIKLREKQILYIEGTELDFLVDGIILAYQTILEDLKEVKEAVREELYGHDSTMAEYKGACERLGVEE